MKLSREDYILILKANARQLALFGRDEGTSLSYGYMRDMCRRLIEVSEELEANFPRQTNDND